MYTAVHLLRVARQRRSRVSRHRTPGSRSAGARGCPPLVSYGTTTRFQSPDAAERKKQLELFFTHEAMIANCPAAHSDFLHAFCMHASCRCPVNYRGAFSSGSPNLTGQYLAAGDASS